jgi:hypothetical protein
VTSWKLFGIWRIVYLCTKYEKSNEQRATHFQDGLEKIRSSVVVWNLQKKPPSPLNVSFINKKPSFSIALIYLLFDCFASWPLRYLETIMFLPALIPMISTWSQLDPNAFSILHLCPTALPRVRTHGSRRKNLGQKDLGQMNLGQKNLRPNGSRPKWISDNRISGTKGSRPKGSRPKESRPKESWDKWISDKIFSGT